MTYLFIFLIILLFFLLGYSIQAFLFSEKSMDSSARFGLGYGVTLIIVIIQMFVFSVIKIPINVITILLPWCIWIAYYLHSQRFIVPSVPQLPKSMVERVLIILLISLAVFVSLESILRLPTGWDAIATWLLQGKGFYFLGGLNADIYHYAQIDSPPGIGFLLLCLYTLSGSVADNAVLLLFSSFYIAILAVLYGSIKNLTNRRTAIIFVFLFATLQSVIRQAGRFEAGYADLPLSYFFLCSAVLLLQFQKSKKPKFLLYACFFAGASSFIKTEGSAFFLVFLIVAFLTMLFLKKWHVKYLFPGILLFLLWQIFKFIYLVTPSYLSEGRFVFERIGVVSERMFFEFFRIDRWNFLWLFLISSLVFVRKKLFRFIPFQLLFLQLFGYFLIYMITPLDPTEHIIGSFDRLLIHLAPLAILSSAICAYGILKNSSFLKDAHIN